MTILYDKINFHLIFVAKTWNPECSGMIKGSIKEGGGACEQILYRIGGLVKETITEGMIFL